MSRPSHRRFSNRQAYNHARFAGLETCDTADLEVCGTIHFLESLALCMNRSMRATYFDAMGAKSMPQISFALSCGFAISGWSSCNFTRGGALGGSATSKDSRLPRANIVRPFRAFSSLLRRQLQIVDRWFGTTNEGARSWHLFASLKH